MSSQWWDPDGPMAPLHDFTPVRIDYILDSVRRLGTGGSANGVEGLRILDIGCGGGLLAEPMARLGADVTGIDATPEAIAAAAAHAEAGGLEISYRCCTAEALAARGFESLAISANYYDDLGARFGLEEAFLDLSLIHI